MPERITNTIVDGIPVRVREVAIEIFPSIVQEEWKEVFPAHIEEDNRIILGPQVIDREIWDNIYYTENQTAQEIIIKEKKGAINQEFPKEWLNKTIDEINKAAKAGNKSARKAKKLINDKRFDKGDNRK